MTAHQGLPIYREAMRLTAHLHQCTRKAPRDLRHTLVQRLLEESVQACVHIAAANKAATANRAAAIAALSATITRIDVLLHVAREQHCLSTGAAAVAMEHIDALGKQAHGWGRHTNSHGGKPESGPST